MKGTVDANWMLIEPHALMKEGNSSNNLNAYYSDESLPL